jgi:chromosome segregation protein
VFLRSLTLKGFKSFADTTTLQFEPGVTVVVGPNGSGKSNLVDAVAWVLGAQGPRTVRSGRMDDVIFAGSGQRSPLGRAEVALTIDNSAALLPIEFSEVTITRTLFRSSGESEYALNGVPCRLLDVQELLSDTGVGRQQHVIVSQGNLDAVLDARPEDRRMIVEEAAGILKFRRRKEKAQRRLEATEANLLRLGDLLKEVRRQLRPLERQAEAARRHGELAGELRALRLHVAGRGIAALRARLEAGGRARDAVAAEESSLRRELGELDGAILAAESWLTASGGSGLDEALGRLEALFERARGLAAVVAERRRSIARDREVTVDSTVVASLEVDAAALAAELDEVEAAILALAPDLAHLATAEAELAQDRDALDARGAEAARPSGRAAEARGELAALRAAADRDRAERARLENRLAALEAEVEVLAVDAAARRADLGDSDALRHRLAAALDEVTAARDGAAADVAGAEASRSKAEGEVAVWRARVDALTDALSHARPDASSLAGLEGVVGTLAEMVEVDPGWEAAFEAAAGDALATVVVDGVDAARAVLAARHAEAGSVSVLTLGSGAPAPPSAGPTAGAEPVRAHVRSSRDDADALLDVVLAPAVAVAGGWEQALDLAVAAPPGTVVVTRAGDRFSAAGWRIGGGGPAATEAALAEARRRAEEAEGTAAVGRARLDSARDALSTQARRYRARADALVEHDRERAALADGLGRTEARHREATTAADGVRVALADQEARLASAEARLAELEAAVPALEAEEEAGAEVAAAVAAERRRLDERADALAALATELEIRRIALEQRRTYLLERRADVERRLARLGADREAAAARRAALDLLAVRTGRLAAALEGRLAELEARVADTRLRRAHQAEAVATVAGRLDSLRQRRTEVDGRLEAARDRSRRIELEEAEGRMRLEAAVEAVRRDLDAEPADAEIVELLSAAYADVADNFGRLFETLFPGGQGRLRLTDVDNLLDTGIEVEARPAGKNVRRLSLLSGGERSLVALAFLFAVFRSRPSPFYLLDEVEAALDDVNLHRFLDLLAEFREDAQLLVVSHQKRTMEAADSLYGVTMQPGGSSRVVSQRVGAFTG